MTASQQPGKAVGHSSPCPPRTRTPERANGNPPRVLFTSYRFSAQLLSRVGRTHGHYHTLTLELGTFYI